MNGSNNATHINVSEIGDLILAISRSRAISDAISKHYVTNASKINQT